MLEEQIKETGNLLPLESQTPTQERGVFVPETKETQPEIRTTQIQPIEFEPKKETSQQATQTLKNKPGQIPRIKDETISRIEKIMEEDLKDAFTELTPTQKQEFKIKGEETATKIRKLLNKTKVNIKKIVSLLLEWLRLLPGINKFFLEQEAKIKADKIMSLKYIGNTQ